MRFFAILLSLSACNDYDYFRVAGHTQESFSNEADILFIVDNSMSMRDEAEDLAVNFDQFITQLAARDDQAEQNQDGLGDAVNDYVDYVGNRIAFIDYQIGITTTDVTEDEGDLLGTPRVINPDVNDIAAKFTGNLVCDSACIPGDTLVNDNSYECGDALTESVSEQYVDCACDRPYDDHCATSGDEEPLEAVFLAMCRAVEAPPEECFDSKFSGFDNSWVESNAKWLRDGSSIIPVIITDEGDQSRRAARGEVDAAVYEDLFDLFRRRMAFAVIGAGHSRCDAGAANWGGERLQHAVSSTSGLWVNIAEPNEDDECEQTDFSDALEQLGALLRSLLEAFPLQTVPNIDTLVVVVDGVPVDRAEETTVGFGDGWSYRASDNAVVLHGDAVPDFNQEVRIYYKPLEGMPRELPF